MILRPTVLGVLALLAAGAPAQTSRVIVRPVEIHDMLVNHGMGITTFQRFNGEPPIPACAGRRKAPPPP